MLGRVVPAALTIAAVLAIFYLAFGVFFPLGRGAVYVPSSREKTSQMSEMAEVTAGERAVDLGSGDGRVVIELASRGAEAEGYEINPVLVLLSRMNIRRAGMQSRAIIHWGSFWRADLSACAVVIVFQGSFVMRRLESKLRKELPHGARVITDYWRLPGLAADATRGTIYRYRIE
jgi:hypothetical protein